MFHVIDGFSPLNANVFWLYVRAGFQGTKLSTSIELKQKHKAPSLHVPPPDAKPVLH